MSLHPTFARAALGGFVGTLAMTAMMYIVAPMMGLRMGAGLFSSAVGGMMAAMGSLIGHILYGSLLGIVASAPEARLAHA
jgi:hypothetical protein